VGNPPKQTNYTTRLLQLKLEFDSTLQPFQLATKNGIGLGLRRITRRELSLRFLLDLKKLNNIMSFCVLSIHRCHPRLSNLKNAYKKHKQNEVEKHKQRKFMSHCSTSIVVPCAL
jgi:hypothetical protein